MFLLGSEVWPVLQGEPLNVGVHGPGVGPLLLGLGVAPLLPDHDGLPHPRQQAVPRGVELGQRDDLLQAGLVQLVQRRAALGAEQVDGAELALVPPGELGVGVAAGQHDVGQGVPAGLGSQWS